MNFKKFISGISALTIAASAFAGLAVTASASDVTTSDDCSDLTATETSPMTWTVSESSSSCSSGVVEFSDQTGVKVANITNANSSYSATGTFTATQTKLAKVSVNAYISYTNSGNDTFGHRYNMKWYVRDASGNVAARLDSKWSALYVAEYDSTNNSWGWANGYNLGLPANKQLTHLGSNSTNKYNSSGYVDIDFLLNFYAHKATVSYGSTSYTVDMPSTITSVSDFRVDLGNCYNGVVINNVTVTEYTCPELTIADNAEVNVSGTTTVEPTAIVGELTSAVSNDTSIATAEVVNGAVQITGVATGSATVKATVTSEGYTYTQDIAVTVGAPETITVNYYKTGTTTAVKTADTLLLAAGEDVTASDIDTADFVSGDVKYVYNSSDSTALPYTVVSGTNTINIYFDEKAKANTLHVSYSNGTSEIGYKDIALTDKYVGDSVAYYNVAYVAGSDGKLYKYASLPDTAAQTSVGSDWSYQNPTIASVTEGVATTTLTYSEVTGYLDYELKETGTATADQVTSRVSGGNFDNSGSPYTLFTVEEAGTYTITVVTAWRSGWSGSGANGAVSVNDVNIEDPVSFDAKNDSTKPFKFEYTDVKLKAGDVIKFVTAQGRVGVDYALLLKTENAAPTTSATATAQFVKDYEATKEWGVAAEDDASVWAVQIANTGDTSITKIGMKLGDAVSSQTYNTNIDGSGSIIFPLVINKLKEAVEAAGLTVILNDGAGSAGVAFATID